ncbi:hypothetical protein HZH66_004696 [Vespula vulgaris]|uniref:Uncharacterized protein n=1 Tax=Vespula vulgaris TaxID=7454 RepID=A0A834K8J5_VESVU|nr:hypothetical protein HZH66_004696 [Vespula vulgaris]
MPHIFFVTTIGQGGDCAKLRNYVQLWQRQQLGITLTITSFPVCNAIDFSTVKREEQQSRVCIANISSIDVVAITIVAIAAARMRVIQLSAAIYWLSDHPTNLSVDTPILS